MRADVLKMSSLVRSVMSGCIAFSTLFRLRCDILAEALPNSLMTVVNVDLASSQETVSMECNSSIRGAAGSCINDWIQAHFVSVDLVSFLIDSVLNSVSSRGQHISSRPGHGEESCMRFRSTLEMMMENAKDTNVALSSDNSMMDEAPDLLPAISGCSSS